MKITVTKDDIREGARNCCWACPVALAILRTLNRLRCTRPSPHNQEWVRADYDYLMVGHRTYRTPEQVYDFMRSFDARPKSRVRLPAFAFDLPVDGIQWAFASWINSIGDR